MTKSDREMLIIMGLAIVAVIIFAIGMVWMKATFEAQSYNKYCDTPVTTWDAVWLDLRIDECVRCDDNE